MAKGIEIGIASETRAFKQGVESGVVAPVEDAVDKLEQLGKTRGPEQLEEGLRDAQDASTKLQREVRDTANEIEKRFREAYRDLANASDDGTRRAVRGFDDLRDESKQTLRETAASVKDVSDGLDAVQEIAANAFVGFGPAGFLAGATAASGIGLISEALRISQEATDELKRRFASMYQQATEDGRAFLDEAQIQAATLDIIFGDNQDVYRQAQKDARELGLSTQEVVRALAGDQEALNHVLERTNELQAAHNAKLTESTSPMETRAALMTSEGQTLDEITSRYETQLKLVEENAAKAQEYLDSTRQSNEEIQKMNKSLAETPSVLPVQFQVDRTAIDAALQRRTLRIDVEGYTRDGARVV